MDLTLSAEQQQLRDLARDWVEREVVPHATEWDRAEQVDPKIVGKLAELGFLGLGISEAHGGSGGDFLDYAIVMEELGRGDTAVRGIVSVTLGLVAKTIQAYGTDEQRAHWLPRFCSGETLGCFALTEPGTGSDAGNLVTRAVRDGDDWLISGEKIFITNGTWAGVALVFARTGGPGPKGVSAFLVPTDRAGLTRREIKGKLGLRGQATAELSFEQVRVADAERLGDLGAGFKIAMSALDKGRIAVASGCVGLSRACLEAAVAYAGERTQFAKPIASYQLVQEMLADIAVETEAARLLVWRAADLVDRRQPFGTAASMAKLFASEAAVKAANQAIQVFGGYGYIDEFPVGKFMRDARVQTLYEGTSQIQKLLIGRALTGISAF
ncbi:butyryl-CoA dehydrogenase [Actinoplanes sp. SE50]|uniref:acyl-CoA dehydrogenase family protein n=1 Tax=unclassified Actinoplanes TaxID=2626549 RepID=UPI00023ED1ED|nr:MULTISPECIES: acyl-CoA dehydrogenase family protein [unclassified Actinoplanes]AEV83313.1 acyl-CoA dehydrogenase [Actinoplanes sp. SE50/110]ATO81706.1 butyryl-CoA dehydrogenase [Actinoplanes sp. SE50]SLL99114.1 butyryl-CoA dehydrogenase [Actinoplanes sp. SE50/110]